jgi:hypothetical protein
MTETLQVQYQVLGAPIYLHLFKSVLMILTFAAIPFIISREGLFLAEEAQAIFNCNVCPAPESCAS